MKRNNLNRIFKLGILSLLVAFMGTSCVKSVDGYTNFDDLTPHILIPEGGMQNFQAQALLFPPTHEADTTYFHLNYAAKDVAPVDQVIEIGVDMDALAAYNALGGNQYEIFPDSIYSFTTTSVTVPKGNSYSDAIALYVFPVKINLLKNYMLPISIKTTPVGSTVSENFKTIYYHLIGNPIAGLYDWEWIRWNTAGQVGPPAFDEDFSPGVFAPIDGTTIATESGTGPVYLLSFTDNAGVLSDFQVEFEAGTTEGITITGGPTIVTADPTTGTYIFNYTYTNSSGSPRNIIDSFHK